MIANRIRSKSNVPEGGFQPGDFSFDDVTFNAFADAYTNIVTFNKSGTLYITGIPDQGLIGSNCDFNVSNILDFWLTENRALTNANSFGGFGDGVFLYNANYAVIDVTVNDTMKFYFYNALGEPFADNSVVEIRVDSFNGTLIDSFTVTQTFGGI